MDCAGRIGDAEAEHLLKSAEGNRANGTACRRLMLQRVTGIAGEVSAERTGKLSAGNLTLNGECGEQGIRQALRMDIADARGPSPNPVETPACSKRNTIRERPFHNA